MTRRKWEVSSVVLGLCLCLGLWLAFRPTGPEYQGRHLSSWIEAYDYKYQGTNPVAIANADAAVRGLGTNAIPYLLELLHKRDPIPYSSAEKNWHINLARLSSLPRPLRPADNGYYEAVAAFRALSPSVGKTAVPELTKILRDPDDPAGDFVPGIFIAIGSETVPVLTQALHDPSAKVQQNALHALRLIGAASEPAVPEIVKLLDSPNSITRRRAADALVAIGKNPSIAAPALAKRFAFPEHYSTLRSAEAALSNFGPEARGAVPDLIAALDAPWEKTTTIGRPYDSTVSIAKVLCKVAPDEAEKHAEKIFRNLLERGCYASDEFFTNFLETVPNSRKGVTPLLIAGLNERTNARVMSCILKLICFIGPDAKEAQPALRDLVELQERVEREGAEAAGSREMISAMKHWDAETQVTAALYAIAPEESLEEVIGLLTKQFDRDPRAYKSIVPKFDEFLGGRSAPVYMAMLDNPEIRIKKHGLRALAWLEPGPTEALPKIQALIDNPQAQSEDPELRSLALKALKEIGPSQPQPGP